MSDCCNNFDFVSQQGSFDMSGGIRGSDGTTFYPHVSAEGVLSWTNDGGKQNPDPVNIKGADGKSAYAAAVEAGFAGTEAEFEEYLSGIGDLSEEVSQQKSAIEQAPTEETGQELLTEEELNTLYTEYFLKTLDRIFSELPQDESLSGIVDELVEENSWLDQLYREVAAAKT